MIDFNGGAVIGFGSENESPKDHRIVWSKGIYEEWLPGRETR